jgi:hypothetical protein
MSLEPTQNELTRSPRTTFAMSPPIRSYLSWGSSSSSSSSSLEDFGSSASSSTRFDGDRLVDAIGEVLMRRTRNFSKSSISQS